MADQIKNENVGEVSSPTPEVNEAPVRKEPVFAAQEKKPASIEFEAKSEDTPAEYNLERKLPVFKDEKEGADGAKGDKGGLNPQRLNTRRTKLPVFADEAEYYEDEDEDEIEDDDVEYTSDAVSIPFMAAPAMAAVNPGNAVAAMPNGAQQENASDATPQNNNQDQLDKRSPVAGTMPSDVSSGGEYYPDLIGSSLPSYVPTYEKENAIMAKHQKVNKKAYKSASVPFAENGADNTYIDITESAPAPQTKRASKKQKADTGVAEAAALLAAYEAEKASSANTHSDIVYPDATENKSADESVASMSATNGKWVDPGIEEAAALLEAYAAVKAGADATAPKVEVEYPDPVEKKPGDESDDKSGEESVTESAPVESGKWVDPGLEEAAALLEAYAAEKQRIKELKKAKRNAKRGVSAVVVETEDASDEVGSDDDENQTPVVLTVAASQVTENEISTVAYDARAAKAEEGSELKTYAVVSGAKKIKFVNEAEEPKAEVVYPDAEAYEAPIAAEPASTDAPKTVAFVSTGSYDSASQKKADKQDAKAEKKAEREALLAVAAAEKQKAKEEKVAEKVAKNATNETAPAVAVVYGDVEPYFAPEMPAPAPAVKAPKAKSEFSPESYESASQKKVNKQDAKAEKKAEREALLAVAAAEKQKAKDDKAAEKAAKHANDETAPAVAVVYGDVEPYVAPEAPAPVVDNSKAEAKAAKAASKNQQAATAYDQNVAGKQNKAAVAAALVAFYSGNKPVAPKTIVKPAPTAPAEIVYPDVDYTEGYDPNWQATEAAEKAAAIEAEREAKRLEDQVAKEASIAQRNSANQGKYESHEEKALLEKEQREELLLTYKEEIEREKAAKAADKESAKAAKAAAIVAAAAAAEAAKPVFADFTETFDQEAYDADKQAIADAEAKAKADAKAVKEAEKAAKADASEAKKVESYNEANDKWEQEETLLATNKQYKTEAKERKAEEKEAEKAAKAAAIVAAAAAAEAAKPVFADFTETFDQEAYDADKQAIADAEAKAKADAKAAKEAEKADKENESYNSVIAAYNEKNTVDEEAAEMLALVKQDKEDRRTINKNAKLKAKAERLAAFAKDEPEVIYPDPVLVYDEHDIAGADVTLPGLGDVLVGDTPKIVHVAETRRVAEEDRKLKILITKDKRRVKKVQRELEILELAGKYVDDGSLEMADSKVVVKDASLAKREYKYLSAVKEYEAKLEDKELLYFAEDYDAQLKKNKNRLKRAKKYGKFMLEYGSTYDPEWDGEFNNYGLPEVHPFTEGVKLSTGRVRTPKKEAISYFDKKKLTALSQQQCDTDNQMIEARVEYDYIALELEVSKVEKEFSGEYRNTKEKRWLRDSKTKLKNIKRRIASALKYEKLDNERYYSVVATDFSRVELPAKADREELVAMREELLRLLDIRDDINAELLELYTGTENGMKGSIKGRAKVVLKARKRAHAKFRRYHKQLSKHRVTRNEKMRIFDKMDEVVDLKGQLAKIKYILRKENPAGKVRREYIKEKQHIKRDIRILNKSIERTAIRALRKAKKIELQKRAMITAYVLLGTILLGAFVVYTMGPALLEASKSFLPEDIHQYIDQIKSLWQK